MAKKGKAPPSSSAAAAGGNSSLSSGETTTDKTNTTSSSSGGSKQAFILNDEHFDAADSVDFDEISTKQIEKAEAFRRIASAEEIEEMSMRNCILILLY